MNRDKGNPLQKLLEAVAAGEITPAIAFDKLKHQGFEPVSEFAKIDRHRYLRNGFPEVIWGQGKTPEQIIQIIEVMRSGMSEDEQEIPILATRIEGSVFAQLSAKIPDLQYDAIARICFLAPGPLVPRHRGKIAVIAAGTSDLPVAREAALTAELLGFEVSQLTDVGVAGIHRLLSNLSVIAEAHVLIVVAGMEGALPSVVGGLADCPVIAVPTSIGYGANFQGLAPLLTMLNSCVSGIAVMNIDNGFGAAILAGQILRTAQKLQQSSIVEEPTNYEGQMTNDK
ncbi:MAG: nickel pincer cofactor biosynthesis protein LarB [Cyanobacteriota bacterium]|nr:nickel pincer cofactor biosynthesis protein LarB [Cyanobacteriota bacterium]